ncbi:MAG: PilZ domain-containing protein [Spongiibacteraceae bacterium]|jgi:hypothetical protein|nr:PilZ domain-containing protein [Spongiibacteraceae bacterium]
MTPPDLQQQPYGSDRRREARLAEQAMVFVECLATEPDSSAPGSIVLCRALDMSPGGMQVLIDQAVPAGSILRLCTHLRGATDDLFLVGEVRWQRQTEDGYWTGFQFYDSDQTDIAAWQAALAEKLPDPES